EDDGTEAEVIDAEAEQRGLRRASFGILGMLAMIVVMTAPSGAPLRDAETDAIIGATPFMASLIFLISLTFLICGICYGTAAGTITGSG
ncbi:AbgT family transporter, partial [Streptomyces caeruleatus]